MLAVIRGYSLISLVNKRLKSIAFLGSVCPISPPFSSKMLDFLTFFISWWQFHSSDLLQVFFSGELQDYFIHFFNGRDPNYGSELLPWPRYELEDAQLLTLLDGIQSLTISQDTFRKDALQLLGELSLQSPQWLCITARLVAGVYRFPHLQIDIFIAPQIWRATYSSSWDLPAITSVSLLRVLRYAHSLLISLLVLTLL